MAIAHTDQAMHTFRDANVLIGLMQITLSPWCLTASVLNELSTKQHPENESYCALSISLLAVNYKEYSRYENVLKKILRILSDQNSISTYLNKWG